MPPKRKGNAVTSPKPAKKAKTGGTPTRTSPRKSPRNKKSGSETPPATSTGKKPRKPAHPGSKAVKAPDEDANFEWEILDGDERSTLVVGEAQTKRLTLKFHHRHDKNESDRTFKYDRRGEKEINWNNKDHIRDINKWRNQIFVQNMKFPPKVTHTPWTPFETAYLELFHEKLLEAATGKTDTFVAPHNELIFEAFNDYFEGRTDVPDKSGEPMEEALGTRPPGGLNSYLNRAGTKIRGLRDRMRALEPKLKKSKKEDAWMPTITDDEIEQYIKGEWESAVDTTAAVVTATADDDGEEEEEEEDEEQAEDEGEDEDEDQAEDEDNGNVSDGSTLTTPPETDEELESMEIAERERQAKRLIIKLKLKPSTASKFPGSKRPTTKPTAIKPTTTKPTTTKPTVTKPTTTKPITSNPASNTRSTGKATSGRSSTRSSSPPPREKSTKKTSPTKKTMTDPRKATEAPEPKSKPRVVKPVETPPIPTHPDVIADLKAKGYTWTELPKNNEEAIKAHREAQNAKPSENAWIEPTKKNLEDRIGRQTSADFNREFFNKDLKEKYEGKGKMVNVEDWYEKSARRAGAAEVTALLNTADIPPLGYTGDIRDLHKKRLLSEDELELADAREVAIPRMHEAVERARQMKVKEESDKDPNLKAKHDRATAMQKDVAYDSDITTSGEDTDEEA
ncbi:hypothetical protein J4E90_008991 [Alternaria incomplexa]|uniref:uncharacterized protein n=1 Tax=Alternaria incomplexa TaxID=1187928 RepID=UPI002221128B|nr:uncharacterized protein J4E90_008991 [Alternaria incomplexa]KAI4908366.1 hypothetical protein J4E90_008991 [Alternaria incomplexa]